MSKSKAFNANLFFIKISTPVLILLLITLSLLNITNYSIKNKKTYILGDSDSYSNLISYWNNFLIENPTYKPGWIRLAYLEFENGNIVEAKRAYWKAFEIDPNQTELENLKRLLGI